MRKFILSLLLIYVPLSIIAVQPKDSTRRIGFDYQLEWTGVGGWGTFTPFYQLNYQHGLSSLSPNYSFIRAKVGKQMSEKRFDWGVGLDIVGGLNDNSPRGIHQLYAELKYRSVDLMIGKKEYTTDGLNPQLSSGGLIWSGNASPIPQIKIGIFDFTPIPFTNEWVQIKGTVSYGIFMDDSYKRNNFGYQYGRLATDVYYHHKTILFRSKESMPFVFSFGMEDAVQFCGEFNLYSAGQVTQQTRDPLSLKALFLAFIPGAGGESEYESSYVFGNHLGGYHIDLEYKFKNRSKLKGYFRSQFEDGSGVGLLNGGDGLYGLEWTLSPKTPWLRTLLVEFYKSTDQSGPIHYWPPVQPGQGPPNAQSTGADSYYQNHNYGTWSHYGMMAGTPFALNPTYFNDGRLDLKHNRIIAYHLGAIGSILPDLHYRLKAAYLTSWGTYGLPLTETESNLSGLIELTYVPHRLKGWSLQGTYTFDHGTALFNNNAVSLTLRKSGKLF